MLNRKLSVAAKISGLLLSACLALGGMAHAASPNIAKVQQLLSEMGYSPGEADGLMGPATRSALALFQQDYDLPETGKADKPTLVKLATRHQRMLKLRKEPAKPADYAFFGDKAAAVKERAATVVKETKAVKESMPEVDLPEEPKRTFSLLAVTQEQLEELGYDPGAYDGDMTPGTREALIEFQEANDLEATGKPDQATNDMLNKRMLELKRKQTGMAKKPLL